MQNPEQTARADIDRLLRVAGWVVRDYRSADLNASRGIALREFELASGRDSGQN
jgi:type I restriction enzyme R subunit